MSEPLSRKQKNDFYIMAIFMKIAADYAEMLHKDGKVERHNNSFIIGKSISQRAKFILQDVFKFNNNLIARFRNALTTPEGREVFDAEWQKDYLAWGNVFNAMALMNEDGIKQVELFCTALLRGEVRIELEETKEETT